MSGTVGTTRNCLEIKWEICAERGQLARPVFVILSQFVPFDQVLLSLHSLMAMIS